MAVVFTGKKQIGSDYILFKESKAFDWDTDKKKGIKVILCYGLIELGTINIWKTDESPDCCKYRN